MSKRRLKIDLSLLEMAFEDNSYSVDYYLDKETGDIVIVDDEIRSYLDQALDSLGEIEDTPQVLEEHLKEMDIPDWQQNAVMAAYQAEWDEDGRFVSVPSIDSRTGWSDMHDFIETVDDSRVARLLEVAIDGQGAFRRFKNVLFDYPKERERWFAFKQQCMNDRIARWLEGEGIELIDESTANALTDMD